MVYDCQLWRMGMIYVRVQVILNQKVRKLRGGQTIHFVFISVN